MSTKHQCPYSGIALASFQKRKKKICWHDDFWHLKLFCWVVQFIPVQIQGTADEVWQSFIHTPELIVCNKLVIHCTWILRNRWQSSAIPQRPESSTNSSVCLSWCKTLAISTCVLFHADRAALSILQHFDFTLGTAEGKTVQRGRVSNKKLRITHTYLRFISPGMDHSSRMSHQAATAVALQLPLHPVTTLPLGVVYVCMRSGVRLKVHKNILRLMTWWSGDSNRKAVKNKQF